MRTGYRNSQDVICLPQVRKGQSSPLRGDDESPRARARCDLPPKSLDVHRRAGATNCSVRPSSAGIRRPLGVPTWSRDARSRSSVRRDQTGKRARIWVWGVVDGCFYTWRAHRCTPNQAHEKEDKQEEGVCACKVSATRQVRIRVGVAPGLATPRSATRKTVHLRRGRRNSVARNPRRNECRNLAECCPSWSSASDERRCKGIP